MTRKEKIMLAATDLFARKGFNGTAASEIARAAGVAQGTVFHHFKSKENLLFSICDELVKDYVKGIEEAAAGPGTGWDSFERLLEFSHRFRLERYNSIVVAFRETRALEGDTRPLHGHFCALMERIITLKKECIERGIMDGSIRPVPSFETALLIHILLSGLLHVQTQGLLALPDLDSEVLAFCRRSLANVEHSGRTGGKADAA